MTAYTNSVDKEIHRKLAVDLFNSTWELIEKPDRTPAEDDMMIHTAHASRYHWGVVGTPLHFARGEWQLSRVYALVGRVEPAMHHGRQSLDLCTEHSLGDFDLGFAYEALARSFAVQGDTVARDKYLQFGREAAEKVEKEADKKWLLKNIESVDTLSLPVWE